MRRPSATSKRAFSLGEILIAIAFVTIAVLAAIGVQAYALKGQVKASEHFHAAQKAEAVMADIESVLGTDLDIDVSVERSPLPTEYNPEGVPEFEYTVTQSDIGLPSDRLKEVQVTIFWRDEQGEQKFFCGTRFTDADG